MTAMFHFTIRDVLWLMVVVALVVTLWVTRSAQIGAQRQALNALPAAEEPSQESLRKQTTKPPTATADGRGAADGAAASSAQFGGHTAPVRYLKLSPDSRQLLSCSDGTDGAATLRLWDVTTGKLIRSLPASSAHMRGTGFAPEGRRVVVASPSAIELYDAADGQEIARQRVGEAILCLDVAPQSSFAALGLLNGDV